MNTKTITRNPMESVRRPELFGPTRRALFWSKVNKDGDSNACWNWTGVKDHHGYGKFGIGRCGSTARMERAHRISYAIVFGAITAGFCVLHKCDNPSCVRPSHLRLGTQLENVDDMIFKGRVASGERHNSKTKPLSIAHGERKPNSKLTRRDVLAMRFSWKLFGLTIASISRCFSISDRAAADALKGKNWKHAHLNLPAGTKK